MLNLHRAKQFETQCLMSESVSFARQLSRVRTACDIVAGNVQAPPTCKPLATLSAESLLQMALTLLKKSVMDVRSSLPTKSLTAVSRLGPL